MLLFRETVVAIQNEVPDMTVQCCKCHKVRVDDHWVDLPRPVRLSGQVSHGYCPKCAEEAFAEIHKHITAQHKLAVGHL